MKTRIFEIFAEGIKIGICVAHDPQQALRTVQTATTRRTSSKIDESCDHKHLSIRALADHASPIGFRDAAWSPQEPAIIDIKTVTD
jgi:hypothetical protein